MLVSNEQSIWSSAIDVITREAAYSACRCADGVAVAHLAVPCRADEYRPSSEPGL